MSIPRPEHPRCQFRRESWINLNGTWTFALDPGKSGADEDGDASWGYGETPRSIDDFYQRLEALTGVILDLDHVCGYCYTQLTDVEQEQNGIYRYDRSEKFDMARINANFRREPSS